MNINVDNVITVTVDKGVDIEKLNIRYVRPYKRPVNPFGYNEENDSRTSGKNRCGDGKYKFNGEMDGKSNLDSNLTASCKIYQPKPLPSRPTKSYYYGESQEKITNKATELKTSEIDKVYIYCIFCVCC